MGTEPITDEEYERERAMLDAMKAPAAAYAELDGRPRIELPEAEIEAGEDDSIEPEHPVGRLLPPVADRTMEVAELYERTKVELASEGTAPKTAEAIAYIVATLHVADLPNTMGQFRAVLDQLQAVFGSGKAGGIVGKLLGGKR